MKNLNDLKANDLITFTGCHLSWDEHVYTIRKVTNKAILVNGEWIPKSQIINFSMVNRKIDVHDGSYSLYPFKEITVKIPELLISKWFDKINNSKRKNGYAF